MPRYFSSVKVPIFYKIFTLSFSIFLVAILVGDFLLEKEVDKRVRMLLENETRMISIQLARTLAAPLLIENRLQIENVLANIPANSGISRLIIIGTDQSVIADTIGKIPPEVLDPSLSKAARSFRTESATTIIRQIDHNNHDLLITPIHYAGIRIGTFLVVFSEDPVASAQRDIRKNFFILSFFGGILSFLGAFVLSRILSKPVRELHQATQAIGKGDLSVSVRASSNDELGELVVAFNNMVNDLKKSDILKNALIRYVSQDVAERVLEHPELIHVGGIRQKVVILFADIRGFSTLSENLPPEQVVNLLNDYYLPMFEIILSHSGYISNIMGDGIMVVFGIPEFLQNHPDSALHCAIELQTAVLALSRKRQQQEQEVVHFGVGIHLGECIVGNIGSGKRMEYTCVGQAVNIAARIESLAGSDEILISQDLKEHLQGDFQFSPPEPFGLKGIENPVTILRIEGLA